MKTIIVSDVHIKDNKSYSYNKFCDFIYNLKDKNIDVLVLLGDIFDFLYQNPRETYYYKLYEFLKILHIKKTKIYYIYGNHDFNFIFNKFSFIKTYNKLNLTIDKHKALAFHGDGLNKKDYKYLFLKKILRSTFINIVYKMVNENISIYLANLFSNFSRKTNFKNNKLVADFYKNEAKNILSNNNISLLLLAHIHVPCIEFFEKGVYVNSGSFSKDLSYVSIIDGLISIEKFY